jgi:two-component system, OmpR family, response regulator
MQEMFEWVSDAGHIPARWDLRLIGWTLGTDTPDRTVPALYDGRLSFRRGDWRKLERPELFAAVGVDCPQERAAMLARGWGEALPTRVALGELSIRLQRLADDRGALPRFRTIGPLTLDLLHRDARASGRWLALHPREFALLWRLADAAGGRVSRETLMADVWRLKHLPETNSLAVHISRLRAKLARVKAGALVQTDPDGGYRLAPDAAPDRWTAPERTRTQALAQPTEA